LGDDLREAKAGDIAWNFEKFVVSPGGEVMARFRPGTPPDAVERVSAIEANLPGRATGVSIGAQPTDLTRRSLAWQVRR
jgi:hypothetical protein